MKYKKIALIGMMGCGKSAVSKVLSIKTNILSYELDEIFEYMEPIIAKFQKKIKRSYEIAQLQKSLHNISILYNISQAVNFIDDLKKLLQLPTSILKNFVGSTNQIYVWTKSCMTI